MPSLSFAPQFEHHILRGGKSHTIRGKRKRPFKVGDILYMFVGLRTKQTRRFGQARCSRVQDILIRPSLTGYARVSIDGTMLSPDESERLARADGFRDFAEMMGFWEGRLPFKGQIIHWEKFQHTRVKLRKSCC